MVPKGRTGLKIRVMVNRVKEDEKSSELTEEKKKKNAYQAFGDSGEVINFLILLG